MNLHAAQVYYTSCHHGVGVGSGFQIRACSAELIATFPGDARIHELVRAGNYVPPSPTAVPPCAPHPLDPRNEGTAPIAFRRFWLTAGDLAVQRSTYLGADYSGRAGNFFTHSLLCPSEPDSAWRREDPSSSPAFWFTLPEWRIELAPGEDSPNPEALPILELNANDFAAAEDYDRDALRAFLALPGRADAARRVLVALLRRLDTTAPAPKILVRDSARNGTLWVALLAYLLPSALAGAFSFSTYQPGPGGNFDLSLTVPGSRFDISGSWEQAYLIVDALPAETASEVTVPEGTRQNENTPETDDSPAAAYAALAVKMVERASETKGFFTDLDRFFPAPYETDTPPSLEQGLLAVARQVDLCRRWFAAQKACSAQEVATLERLILAAQTLRRSPAEGPSVGGIFDTLLAERLDAPALQACLPHLGAESRARLGALLAAARATRQA